MINFLMHAFSSTSNGILRIETVSFFTPCLLANFRISFSAETISVQMPDPISAKSCNIIYWQVTGSSLVYERELPCGTREAVYWSGPFRRIYGVACAEPVAGSVRGWFDVKALPYSKGVLQDARILYLGPHVPSVKSLVRQKGKGGKASKGEGGKASKGKGGKASKRMNDDRSRW
jgi:hypothetical protein